MGLGANQDDRSQTGRAAVACSGSGDADRGAGGRARGGNRARAQTPGSQQTQGEATGGKAAQTDPATTSTRTKRAPRRPANHPGNSDPWGAGAARARGNRAVAQADLWGVQADQELGQEEQTEAGHKTLPEEQASANLSSRERGSSHHCPQAQEERASGQTA